MMMMNAKVMMNAWMSKRTDNVVIHLQEKKG